MPARDRPHALRRLLRYTRRHRRRMALAGLCSVLNKLMDLAPPVLIGTAVDVVVNRQDSLLAGLGLPGPAEQLWVLGGASVVVWGLESLFQYAYDVLWRGLAQQVQHELRLDAYRHVQRLEMAWFEERHTGRLLSILGDDVNQLERFLDGGANDLIQVGTTVLAIGTAFFLMAPEVAWMAMLPMPLVLWGSFRFQRLIGARYAQVREQAGRLYGQLADNVGGIATIKSFTAEAHEVERIRRESDAYRASNRHAIRLSSAFTPLIRMVIVLGFGAALIFGGLAALDGRLAVGLYAVMVFLTQRLLWPLTRLGATFDLYQRAMASTHRILDLLDTPPGIVDGARALAPADVRGRIVLEEVAFGYHGDLPVLHGLDLVLEAGRTTALVGPTGSGKSTVVRLLLRFHDVDAGRILLDGRDLRDLRLEDLRRAIGFVSQDVFLFPGTVHENIAYGRPSASRDEVVSAAKRAEAHEFVARLPDGYDTAVGERGQRLSGGQRQRLSLARALLKDPPILVLDEATSSVDNETEAAIQRSLERLAHGRTVVVIAHRLSTVRRADRIYVLEEGRLREEGRHEDLLAAGGLYAALWEVQTGGAAARGARTTG